MAGQVSVRLAANVDAYIAAMKRAEASTTGFSRSTQRNMSRVGGQMQTLGRTMSIGVTLPIAALGFASTKMAMDWETSFAQMVGLANVPAEEVDHLKESVLALAGDTAQAPQDLAAGLYLAASAGLDSATALEVVESAAMAAASGMGSTATVTDLLTSVLGSYGAENISAARAADILTAAVSEGKAAPDAMAQSLGAVLPIAASLGIEFEEVAGSVAFLTNAGFSAEEAVTSLRGVMLALIDPTKEAQKQLLASGTSAAEVKAAIDEGGLLGALQLLTDHGFAENSTAASNLFEDNRALVGATALLADESGNLVPIIDAVTTSEGALGDAFSTVADTDAFKMQQAITDLKTAMIEIGEVLLPIAADIGQAISDLAGFFTDLPGPVQTAVLAFGGLAAAAGPLIFIAGSLIKNFMGIKAAMALLAGPASTASLALLGIGAAITAGVLIYQAFTAKSREAQARTREVQAALTDATAEAWEYAAATAEAGGNVDGFAVAQHALSIALTTTGAEGEQLVQALGAIGRQAEDAYPILLRLFQDPYESLMSFGEGAGFAGMELDVLAKTVNETDANGRNLHLALVQTAMDMGYLGPQAAALADELFPTASAMEELQDQSEGLAQTGGFEGLATQFLNTAIAADEDAEALIRDAEARAHANEIADSSIDTYNTLMTMIGELPEVEREAALEALNLGSATGATGDAAAGATPDIAALQAELGAVDEAALTAADAMDAFAKGFIISREQIRKGGGFNQGAQEMLEWADIFSQTFSDYTNEAQNYIETQDAIHLANLGFAESVDEDSTALTGNTEAAITNRAAVMDYGDAIKAHAQAQLAAGVTVTEVNATLEENRKGLIAAAEAAGLNKEEVEALLDAIGLMPEDIETVMKLSGDQLFMKKIENALLELDDLDADFIAEIQAILETQGAEAAYKYLIDKINRGEATLDVRLRVRNPNISSGGSSLAYVQAVARGGYFDQPTLMLGGEAGPEAMLPLTNQTRMSEILGMPGVFGPVAAAMSKLVPSGTASTMGGMGGGGGDTYVENHIHMPPGSNGDDVVRALRKWERRRGPVPISVR